MVLDEYTQGPSPVNSLLLMMVRILIGMSRLPEGSGNLVDFSKYNSLNTKISIIGFVFFISTRVGEISNVKMP